MHFCTLVFKTAHLGILSYNLRLEKWIIFVSRCFYVWFHERTGNTDFKQNNVLLFSNRWKRDTTSLCPCFTRCRCRKTKETRLEMMQIEKGKLILMPVLSSHGASDAGEPGKLKKIKESTQSHCKSAISVALQETCAMSDRSSTRKEPYWCWNVPRIFEEVLLEVMSRNLCPFADFYRISPAMHV